jgi:signal transduction histidine kinase
MMTATVAHELRNLLGGVELTATVVAEQCAGDPHLGPLTGRLLGGITRLQAVAGNLLAAARGGERGIERSPLDLARIVTEVVDSVTLAAAGTGIRVSNRSNTAKAEVVGDAERLRQALLNLALNAVQAMPGGGVLTVDTRRLGDVVQVTVRDTGVGMDAATLRRASEPFFSTRPRGTGLGLAVVQEVAEAHRARLRITSRPGRGTSVRLTFPLAPSDGATA